MSVLRTFRGNSLDITKLISEQGKNVVAVTVNSDGKLRNGMGDIIDSNKKILVKRNEMEKYRVIDKDTSEVSIANATTVMRAGNEAQLNKKIDIEKNEEDNESVSKTTSRKRRKNDNLSGKDRASEE